jgi:hypothetical protein
MKLRARAFGLAIGIVWGLTVFVATIWVATVGIGQTMSLLGLFYRGYTVSYVGAFVGLIWGFINGFIVGVAIAWLYNVLHSALYKSDISGK